MPGRIVDAVIEIPRGGFVKRRADGKVDFVSPLPCPYNYGHVPGTRSGDGDPVDVVVLGARLARGTRVRLPVIAEIDFVDEGRDDRKLVLGERPLTREERQGLAGFFSVYARAKRLLARLRGRSAEIVFRGVRDV